MLPSANDLKAWHSLLILKWCDFILVLRSCDIKCYNNHYLATNSNFSSEKARLKTVNPSLQLAVPPSSFFCWVSDHPASSPRGVQLAWCIKHSKNRGTSALLQWHLAAQVSKAAAQHSRGRVSMARRNVQYLVQTIGNGAPWLSHFPRTLQAGLKNYFRKTNLL